MCSDIILIGQSDFLSAVEDYQIATLSWQHFAVAYGELGNEGHPVRTAVDAAKLGVPFD